MLAAAGAVGAAVALSAAAALGALSATTTTVREIPAPVSASEPEAAAFARTKAPLSIHDIYVQSAPGVVQVTMPLPWALDHVHCYALASPELERPLALAQGEWLPWTAPYTQGWLMLRSLTWPERMSWPDAPRPRAEPGCL